MLTLIKAALPEDLKKLNLKKKQKKQKLNALTPGRIGKEKKLKKQLIKPQTTLPNSTPKQQKKCRMGSLKKTLQFNSPFRLGAGPIFRKESFDDKDHVRGKELMRFQKAQLIEKIISLEVENDELEERYDVIEAVYKEEQNDPVYLEKADIAEDFEQQSVRANEEIQELSGILSDFQERKRLATVLAKREKQDRDHLQEIQKLEAELANVSKLARFNTDKGRSLQTALNVSLGIYHGLVVS